MPKLPPLPLIDNHLFIDNSFLEKLNSCPRAVEYSYLAKRIAAWSKSALNFGGAIHHALARRYKDFPEIVMSSDEDLQMTDLESWFAEKPNPIDDHRTLELGQNLIRGYNHHYAVEEFSTLEYKGRPAVELPFVFPLFKHKDITILYCGRIDLVVHSDGQLFVVDHKTTSMMGEQFFKGLSVSPQMVGYCTGVETIIPTEKCAGFIVNAIKVPRPTIKRGIEVNSECFQRCRTYLQDGQIAEWRLNTIALIEEFLWNYDRGILPQKKSWCVNKFGMCEFFGVCELPADNRALMLSTGQFTDNVWSPLDDFNKTLAEFKNVTP